MCVCVCVFKCITMDERIYMKDALLKNVAKKWFAFQSALAASNSEEVNFMLHCEYTIDVYYVFIRHERNMMVWSLL